MKAPPKATVARAKAALKKGTWPWTAPLVGLEEEADEVLLVEVPGLVLLLLELVLELVPEVEPDEDPHWACWSAWADAWSAAEQLAVRHLATAPWKVVLVQRQVVSVREEQVLEDKAPCKQVRTQAL